MGKTFLKPAFLKLTQVPLNCRTNVHARSAQAGNILKRLPTKLIITQSAGL
jgi:hypothetical protein